MSRTLDELAEAVTQVTHRFGRTQYELHIHPSEYKLLTESIETLSGAHVDTWQYDFREKLIQRFKDFEWFKGNPPTIKIVIE